MEDKCRAYTMEDLQIRIRIGRAVPTGLYERTRIGTRREICRYGEAFKTNVKEIDPEDWKKLMYACVEASGSEKLFAAIKQYCESRLAWLKKEDALDEYSLEILAGRVYRLWEDFPVNGLPESTAFIFEF